MEETFDLALNNHKKNNLQVAEKLYKEILVKEPNHFDAIYNLSKLFAQTRRFNLAKPLLYKVIQIKPKYAKAHNNLGIILTKLKDYQNAINSFKEAIELQPDYSDAYFNHGVVLQELGENNKAIACYEKAIQIKPDYSKAYNNLGIVLQASGQNNKAITLYEKAIKIQPNYSDAYYNLGKAMHEFGEHNKAIVCYEKTIQIKPDYSKAYNNLGIVLQEMGEHGKAISVYKKAISIVPNNIITNGLSDLFKSIKLGNLNKNNSKDFRELFLYLYKQNNINHDDIFNNSKSFLLLEENKNELKQAINSSSLLINNKIIKNLLGDELFLLMLQKSLMADKFLEKILTKIRCEIFFCLTNSNQDVLKNNFDFIISLAEQCFLNEYVYIISKKEEKSLDQLKNKILKNKKINELEIAIFGCYTPLYTSEELINKLKDYKSKNILFNDLITINIKEPLNETKLMNSIKSFDQITDDTSKKVKEQYEEYPYPRWRYANLYTNTNFLLQFNDEIKPNQIELNNKFLNPKILIAGCGTGQHVVSTSRYLNSKILGIDLSLKSLAYAKRKVLELSLENVEFLNADILKLTNLNRKFDIIECVGTLHHLKDPIEGLKILLNLLQPHGLLKLGLYSQIARKNIIKARKLIKSKKISSTIKDIRDFRKSIIDEKVDPSIQQIFNIKDFYSTSMVRDLIFHVQEHLYTLPEISKILKNFNLEFLGFVNSSIKNKYSKFFDKDTKNTSLDNWNKFEMSNQETFSNMYQFWVRRLIK